MCSKWSVHEDLVSFQTSHLQRAQCVRCNKNNIFHTFMPSQKFCKNRLLKSCTLIAKGNTVMTANNCLSATTLEKNITVTQGKYWINWNDQCVCAMVFLCISLSCTILPFKGSQIAKIESRLSGKLNISVSKKSKGRRGWAHIVFQTL